MDNKLLGKRIREERQKLNLTQEKLAECIDISDSYMGQVERGEKSVTLGTLLNLANKLGVTVDFLIQDYFASENDNYYDQLKQLLYERTDKEKQMAIDMIKIMFSHLDNMK
jgi:transcriptional regulator with XRE-family HTH domain